MLKLGISDFLFELTKGLTRRDNNNITGKTKFRIEDVTVNGITYYRCSKVGRDPSKNGIRKFKA